MTRIGAERAEQPRIDGGRAPQAALVSVPRDAGAEAAATGLEVRDVTHAFRATRVLDGVGFAVGKGKVVALLGPSGCGKSTLLRVIAGLIDPDRGRVTLDGRDVTQVSARRRSIGMVFQNFALFPHLTVAENIAYGLVSRGAPRAEIAARVQEMLRLVRLEALGDRFPRQLSGGQQQRVAVARALAVSPSALLLDEPFGALDRALRAELQQEFIRTQTKVGITAVVVTHDQEEAQMVADALVVMNHGRIEQIGAPEAIYDRPASLFVNCFMGRANVFAGTAVGGDGVRLSSGDLVRRPQGVPFRDGAAVVLTVRPEDLAIHDQSEPDGLAATWVRAAPQAQHLLVDLVLADDTPVTALAPRHGRAPHEPGDRVTLRLNAAASHLFPAASATQ